MHLLGKRIRVIFFVVAVVSCDTERDDVGHPTHENPAIDVVERKPTTTPKTAPTTLDEKLKSILESNLPPTETLDSIRDLFESNAAAVNSSVPEFINQQVEQRSIDFNSEENITILCNLCIRDQEEMIALVSLLPPGKLRTSAVKRYGSYFYELNDIDSLQVIYEAVQPGADRRLLASFGARASFKADDPWKALQWIESLEYSDERIVAVEAVNRLLFIDKEGFDDARFLRDFQTVSEKHGIYGNFGERVGGFRLNDGD